MLGSSSYQPYSDTLDKGSGIPLQHLVEMSLREQKDLCILHFPSYRIDRRNRCTSNNYHDNKLYAFYRISGLLISLKLFMQKEI